EVNSPVVNLFRNNPFPDTPPTSVRVNLYMLQPTTLAERIRTGLWWRRSYLGPHLPPVTLDSSVWKHWLPEPELFHWDELIWKKRATRARAIMDRARSGCDPDSLLIDAQSDITPENIKLFWESFVNFGEKDQRRNWKNLPEIVQRIRGTYPERQLRTFELILGRLSLALLVRLEPHYSNQQEPKLEVKSFF